MHAHGTRFVAGAPPGGVGPGGMAGHGARALAGSGLLCLGLCLCARGLRISPSASLSPSPWKTLSSRYVVCHHEILRVWNRGATEWEKKMVDERVGQRGRRSRRAGGANVHQKKHYVGWRRGARRLKTLAMKKQERCSLCQNLANAAGTVSARAPYYSWTGHSCQSCRLSPR
ncbi:hypothetical protein BD311DRAFT_765512 [Dichomitus squalens]|uniref:Uncharacterized protein n=1 Tax=Dichomitus squalens TaxID=114155 RepID=A0A4Q9MGI9_9APHY|nr:hypothetical protein BD311DRAFT_765512 [Dichomitus squalens]